MAQELFEILDANQDRILNANDRENFVENAEKNRVLIDNKVSGIYHVYASVSCILTLKTRDYLISL